MTAAINITPNKQQWIKEYIQETYDVVINDAFDCHTLSEVILKEKGFKISFSTFRRIFDLAKNTNSQSLFVLNALLYKVRYLYFGSSIFLVNLGVSSSLLLFSKVPDIFR